jgi:hypothetical protein
MPRGTAPHVPRWRRLRLRGQQLRRQLPRRPPQRKLQLRRQLLKVRCCSDLLVHMLGNLCRLMCYFVPLAVVTHLIPVLCLLCCTAAKRKEAEAKKAQESQKQQQQAPPAPAPAPAPAAQKQEEEAAAPAPAAVKSPEVVEGKAYEEQGGLKDSSAPAKPGSWSLIDILKSQPRPTIPGQSQTKPAEAKQQEEGAAAEEEDQEVPEASVSSAPASEAASSDESEAAAPAAAEEEKEAVPTWKQGSRLIRRG